MLDEQSLSSAAQQAVERPGQTAARLMQALWTEGGLLPDRQILLDRTLEIMGTAFGDLEDLYLVSRLLTTAHTPRDVLDAIHKHRAFQRASRTALVLFDSPWGDEPPEGATFLAVAPSGIWPEEYEAGQQFELDGLFLVEHVDRHQPLRISDVMDDPRVGEAERAAFEEMGTRSLLLFPLVMEGHWFGMLNLHGPQPDAWRETDALALQIIANQAGVAIYNLKLQDIVGEAERSAESRFQSLAALAHELRTPLTSIQGFASTLLAEDVTWDEDSQRLFISTINQESERLAAMLEDLLDFTQIESGLFKVEPEHVSFSEIVGEALPTLQMLTGDQTLNIRLEDGLPPIHADRRRMFQILANLVDNAAKYSPPGGEISITARQIGDMIEFCVSDEGPGIPEEDCDRLFEPFERGRGTGSISGSGLGLSICRGIVKAHGGEIYVANAGGPGASLCSTVSVAADDELEADESED